MILLAMILFMAAMNDIRSKRIPNWLTYPGMVLGLGYHTSMNGMEGLLFGLGGFFVGILLVIVFFLAGGMGAGDVKLLGVVGAFLGAAGVFTAFLCTALIGGVYALAIMIFNGRFKEYMLRYLLMLKTVFVTHKFIYIPPKDSEALPTLCYGAVIALGASVAVVGFL